MAIVDSYNGFIHLYDIPYSTVVILYLLAKYIAIVAVLVQKCCNCRCRRFWSKVAKPWRKFTSWLIRIIFGGGTEGVSENDDSLTADKEGIGMVYINGSQVTEKNLDVLGAITVCFLLLLLLTMYSTYLLETTFECSDDPSQYCFVRLEESSSSNLIIIPDERIDNCSYFNDLDPSLLVSITCFRYALNANEALAIGGGFLAIFTVGMRFLISTITTIWKWLDNCSNFRKAVQISAFVVLTVFNAIATVILVTFAYIGTMESVDVVAPVVQQVAILLADNGVQLLIMLSAVELLLLLDWNQFKAKDKTSGNEAKNKPSGNGVSGSDHNKALPLKSSETDSIESHNTKSSDENSV